MSEQERLKWYKIIVIILIIAFAIFNICMFSIDAGFMYWHFEDILDGNLFRKTDFLTVHDNLPFLHQKWAMCFLTYITYNIGGYLGWQIAAIILNVILFSVMAYVVTKLNNKYLFANICILILAFLNNTYSLFRPHVISSTFIVIEVYLLELFISNKLSKKKLWIGLFLISLGTMWFHSTMWVLCVITIMPYLVPNIRNLFKEQDYKLRDIWLGFAVILLASLLQPNGLLQYKYMYVCSTALGGGFGGLVSELQAFSFSDVTSLFFLLPLCLFVDIYIVCTRHAKKSLPHILLAGGYIFLAFRSVRMIPLSAIIIVLVAASVMGDADQDDIYFSFANFDGLRAKRSAIIGTILSILLLIVVSYGAVNTLLSNYDLSCNKGSIVAYDKSCDNMVPKLWLSNDVAGKRVWTQDDWGTRAQSCGMIPYTDCRAELFANNTSDGSIYDELHHTMSILETGSEEEILNEFQYLQTKYNFDYYIIVKEWVDNNPNIGVISEMANVVEENDYVYMYEVK